MRTAVIDPTHSITDIKLGYYGKTIDGVDVGNTENVLYFIMETSVKDINFS